MRLEFVWRILREHEGIVSGGKVNRLINGFCGERLPTIHLAHVDLSRGEQRPEHHRGGVGGWQNSLGLDPSLKFFVQTLDCICGAYTAPLARRQANEGEQAFSSLFQAVGDGAVLEPPFADEGLAADLYLLGCRRVDHVIVIRGDLVMQALGGVREQVSVLVKRAASHRHSVPDGGNWPVAPPRAQDNEDRDRGRLAVELRTRTTVPSRQPVGLRGGGGDFGAFEASLWLCARLSSSQAGIRANMRLRLHAMVTRLHSPRAFSRPRIENCRKPITDLMMPNTGSGVCLRSA